MKWFKETFISSLVKDLSFDSEGAAERFISEKQVDVCLRYMRPDRYFDRYFIRIGNDRYSVYVFKKGYGRLTVVKNFYCN